MKTKPKDIQLAGIKHAKEAIAELLNEQSEITAERDRLRGVNAELLAALERAQPTIERLAAEGNSVSETIRDEIRAALAKAKG